MMRRGTRRREGRQRMGYGHFVEVGKVVVTVGVVVMEEAQAEICIIKMHLFTLCISLKRRNNRYHLYQSPKTQSTTPSVCITVRFYFIL